MLLSGELLLQLSLMNMVKPSTRFSYSNLFSIARELRHQPNCIELTPPVRRKLEQAVLEVEGHRGELGERILLRRLLHERQISEVLQGIRTSTCQYCHRQGDLVTYQLKRVTASPLRQRIHEQTELACRSCARVRLAKSSAVSLVAGWWSLAGAQATPYAVFTNLRTLVLELSEAEVDWLLGAYRKVRSWIDVLVPPGKDTHNVASSAQLMEVEPSE